MEAATGRAPDPAQLDRLSINTIRFVSVGAVLRRDQVGTQAALSWIRDLGVDPIRNKL
jgi:hypothetical protein